MSARAWSIRRTSGARISHPRRRRRSRGRSAGRVLRGRSGGGRNFACLCSCRHHTDTLSTRIACFVGCIEDDDEEPCPDSQDWPGSFVTDARMYEEREAKLRARELNSSKLNKSASRVIVWSPSKDGKNPARAQAAPSLTSLCLNTLAKHSECIGSLEGIPEELKNRLFKILCHSMKMNTYLLNELLCDCPTERHLSECSWLSEDDFEKTFGKCSIESLQVLFVYSVVFVLWTHYFSFQYDLISFG